MTPLQSDEKKEKIAALLEKGLLVSPDYIESANENITEQKGVIVLNEQSNKLLSSKDINWKEIDNLHVMNEKTGSESQVPDLNVKKEQEYEDVKIISSYKTNPGKIEVSDFANYFRSRYKHIERLLKSRTELQNLTSISRLKGQINNVSIIGMIYEKQETKNHNIMLTVEDPTGLQRVLINQNRKDLFEVAKDLCPDEIIGITGSLKNNFFFANSLVQPDIPNFDLKKSPDEGYLACMSDLHFGSKQFIPESFDKFLDWVNQRTGSPKQREIASKLKYIVVAGDIVDGIGIYQTQFNELSISDIKGQYDECARFLAKIPSHIKIILSPGNHDAVRMPEPQPPLDVDVCSSLLGLKNVTLVSNPAVFKLGMTKDFPGFICIVYHGYSFDYYVANVDSIRQNGGYERADLIMKYLLKRRHIAPAHTSTLINPTAGYDGLVIDPVPDFFITGHIHRTSVSQYKSVSLLNSSCWQSMTSFQERLGHNPQPARVPVVNLKTRDSTILNFS